MNPSYWGKFYWKVIHITALAYPDNPTEEDKETYHRLYETIGQVLPCKKCTANYERHFIDNPIDYFLEDSEYLFRWTVQLHNIVNKELGKPQWSVEFAKSHYNSLGKNNETEFQTSEYHDVNPQTSKLYYYKSILMIILNVIVIFVILLLLWKNSFLK